MFSMHLNYFSTKIFSNMSVFYGKGNKVTDLTCMKSHVFYVFIRNLPFN